MTSPSTRALEEFDHFCRFIDGMNMGGFVENDFMSKPIQEIVRTALQTRTPPMLQDAAGWIRLLLPLAKGYVHANPGIRSTENIIEDAENCLASLDAVLEGKS